MEHLVGLFKISACIALALTITACQNFGGLTRQQVNVLKSQGFKLSNDGWFLGLSEKLLFNYNESSIKPETVDKITAIGQQLNRVQISHLQLNGYTDSTGSASYNRDLSLKRAQAVAEPLVQGGIPASDIKTVGMGQDNTIADNNTEAGR
ncbi:MAG: OmpA family protein, partial [Candidatus Saccharibacteria bacterium]|nr:OmpA family protein [Moraxellaceae bacterium]